MPDTLTKAFRRRAFRRILLPFTVALLMLGFTAVVAVAA